MKNKPVAVCTICGATTHNASSINTPCGNRPEGKKCRGVFGSTLAPNDWEECPSCHGLGQEGHSRCLQCDGDGWLYARK